MSESSGRPTDTPTSSTNATPWPTLLTASLAPSASQHSTARKGLS